MVGDAFATIGRFIWLAVGTIRDEVEKRYDGQNAPSEPTDASGQPSGTYEPSGDPEAPPGPAERF